DDLQQPGDVEARSIALGKGAWGDPEFPRSGWDCIAIVDMLEETVKCEACQSTTIRFAHVLTHPQSKRHLKVGCVCAGYLLGDLGMARAGDERARTIAAKRARWTNRQWRISRSGDW